MNTSKRKQARIQKRLAYLRAELRAERISYGELAELQSLARYINPEDAELMEAAGVPESTQRKRAERAGRSKRAKAARVLTAEVIDAH